MKQTSVKTNERSLFLQLMGNSPLMKVIDFLIDNKDTDYCKQDIANGAGISRTSLFYIWAQIEKSGIVKLTRKFGGTTLYKLDSKSPVVKQLLQLELALLDKFIDSEAEKRKQVQVALARK